MKPWLLPSGIQRGLPFILPDDWTPEQALAVVELLDDLRERICAHYEIPLHELVRDLYGPTSVRANSTYQRSTHRHQRPTVLKIDQRHLQ